MRLAALILLGAAMAAGCASTGASQQSSTLPGSVSTPAVPGTAHREVVQRSAAIRHDMLTSGGTAEGVPTPEPALPMAHETRFAGPTPQVPIPVFGGGGGSAAIWQ